MSGGTLMPGSPAPAFHPLANLFPMLSDAELDDLGADMQASGQAETIKLHKGMILDGRNRFTAATRKTLPIRFEVFSGTDREALNWVISKNLRRRHLDSSQRAMIAAKITTLRLGDNQHRGEGRQICLPSADLLGEKPPEETSAVAVSQGDAATLMNVSDRGVRSAAKVLKDASPELQQAVESGKVAVSTAAELTDLSADEQREVVARGEKEILEAASKIRKEKGDKRRTERVAKIAAIASGTNDLPTGRKFPVIYFDPPTKFAAGDSDRSTENHYPTMTEEELAALPIGDLATDDAVLFVWTTVPWLRKTIRLCEERWGGDKPFEYVSEYCWDKVKISTGFWNRNRHESLLIFTRGKMPAPQRELLEDSLYTEARTEHSAKPAFFRDMIGRYYPDLPKVELFARVDGAMPDGWHAWGNQARVPRQQSLLDTAGAAA